MPESTRRPPLDLSSGVVLLGDDVPVTVTADVADVAAAADAGAALVVMPVALGTAPEVLAAAGRTTLAVSGPLAEAHLLALDLLGGGAPAGHLLVEAVVAVAADAPTTDQIQEIRSAGLLIGAVLAAESDGSDQDEGWEIAMCTRLLAVGVQTLRAVDRIRFRRVHAVVEAIRSGAR